MLPTYKQIPNFQHDDLQANPQKEEGEEGGRRNEERGRRKEWEEEP